MLVLSRRPDESIELFGPGLPEGGIKILVCEIRGNKVRLGIDAPPAVDILRTELVALSGVPDAGAGAGVGDRGQRIVNPR